MAKCDVALAMQSTPRGREEGQAIFEENLNALENMPKIGKQHRETLRCVLMFAVCTMRRSYDMEKEASALTSNAAQVSPAAKLLFGGEEQKRSALALYERAKKDGELLQKDDEVWLKILEKAPIFESSETVFLKV